MGNPLERYLGQSEDPKKKKKSGGNPLEAYLGEEETTEEPESRYLGFVRGEGRDGIVGTAEDFGRGVLNTAVTGLPGLVEAGAGLAAKVGVPGAKALKEKATEYREGWTKEIDPQGVAGGVGQLAGLFLPGGVGGAYGKMYDKSGKLIEALPKVGPVAAKIAAKAAEKSTGTLGQKLIGLASRAPARAATSAIRGAPINVGIAAGMSDNPEARNKEIAIGIVSDLIFGTLDRGITGARSKGSEPGKPITAESLPSADTPPVILPPERQVKLAEIAAAGAAKKAVKEANAKIQRTARAHWQLDNPDKVWSKLKAEEKQAALKKYIEEKNLKIEESEPHPDAEVEQKAAVVAATTTPRVEAKINEVLEANPEATPDELKAAVAEMPEVQRAQQANKELAEKLQADLRKQGDDIIAQKSESLGDVGKAGGAIVSNMYDALAAKLAKGDLTEGGMPSRFLGEANKRGLKTPEELQQFANGEYSTLERVGEQAPEQTRAGVSEGKAPDIKRFVESTGMVRYETADGSGSLAVARLPDGDTIQIPLVKHTKHNKGIGQALYLRALEDGPLVYDEKRLSQKAYDMHQAMQKKGLVELYEEGGRTFIRKKSDTELDTSPDNVPSRSEYIPGHRMHAAKKIVGEAEFNRRAEAERASSGRDLYDVRNELADKILAETKTPVIVSAAVKYGDDIFTGAMHEDAREVAAKAGKQGSGERGYVDQFGNYHTRSQAQKISDQSIDNNRRMYEQLAAESQGAETYDLWRSVQRDEGKTDEQITAMLEEQVRDFETSGDQGVIQGPEPIGSTQRDADEMEAILEEVDARGLFAANRDKPGEAIENYNAFLREVRAIQAKRLPHEQHMAEIADLVDDFTPLDLDEANALVREAEPTPLSPDEEAALLAETQDLMPPDDASLAQGAQNATEIPSEPQLLPDDALAQPSPVSTQLETANADLASVTPSKMDKLEDALLAIAEDDGKPQALRDAADRDLNKIFEFRRAQNAGAVPHQPLPLEEGLAFRPEMPTQTTGGEILPPSAPPERGKPTKVKAVGTTQTFLSTMDIPKPLEDMTEKSREKLMDTLRKKIEKLDPLNQRERIAELEGNLQTVKDVAEGRQTQMSPVAKAQAEARAEAEMLHEAIGDGEELPPEALVKLMRAPLRKMNATDMKDLARALVDKIKYEPDPDIVKDYRAKLHKVMEEIALRAKDADGPGAARIPPAMGGAALGYAYGYYSEDDDSERVTNAFMWAAVGAGSGALAGRLLKRGGAPKIDRSPAELPGGDWQAEVGQHIITGREKDGRTVPILERFRDAYFQAVRRSYIGERFLASVSAEGLATPHNPSRLMEMFGRWTAQTEAAMRTGPSIYDEFGNAQKLDAPGVHEILKDIDGDVETLGTLMAVRTTIEQGGTIKVPFDLVAANNAFHRIPEKFHQAADKARALSLAMINVLTDAGIVARTELSKFEEEKWYAALERVFKFDPMMGGPAAEKGKSLSVGQVNPLKSRKKGSKDAIKNPFETLIESIPRIYRAAELNKIKSSFVDAWEAAGKPDEWMQPISGKEAGDYDHHLKKVDEIRAEIKGLSVEHAHALVAGFDASAINIDKGTMRIYRDGKIQNYKIHGDLARALISLNPDEMHMAVRMLGAPARLASTGVVMNPFFVAKMGFFDMFQATINSQYGFRPGIDNVRGWWNIVSSSPRYQKLLAVGLSHQSLAGANVENIKTTFDALRKNEGRPLDVMIRHLKEGRPLEFYKALVAPVADAARVGEALRALDHGASDLDAVYAAKTVTGNYQERGAWAGMRALQHMTMFLGPALQVLDTSAHRGGVHPFRAPPQGGGIANRGKAAATYAFKAFVMIGLPSYYFWHAAQDDDEIKELRTAEAGRKWWFYRLPWDVKGHGAKGDIIKIPKPILDGQLMGTSVEMALDAMNDENPVGMGEFTTTVLKDMAFNLTPTVGVIPYSLQANQDLGRGFELYPEHEKALDLEHRGEASASFLSRHLSKKIAPIADATNLKALENATTPAGLDFLVNAIGGMLGKDALTAASAVAEYESKGYVPALRELPIINQVLVTYPSTRTRSVQEFYKNAEKFERASATFNHHLKEDPDKAVDYMEAHQAELQYAKLFDSTRSQMAAYRRMIANVKAMEPGEITSEDRRKLIKDYTEMMLEAAQLANDLAK